jgi:hypothetical protein
LTTQKTSSDTGVVDENFCAHLQHHAAMLRVIERSILQPSLTDHTGRNGLHCLAEAALSLEDVHTAAAQGSFDRKKRHDQTTSSDSRYNTLQLLVEAGVSVNAYDLGGHTVLMSWVEHQPDGEDDKLLAMSLKYLMDHGADTNWRDRSGESALHLAVRRGRKVATRTLLEHGTNVHARNLDGRGVLAVGEVCAKQAREHTKLYAGIMACMALCVKYGAVAKPTKVDEWTKR